MSKHLNELKVGDSVEVKGPVVKCVLCVLLLAYLALPVILQVHVPTQHEEPYWTDRWYVWIFVLVFVSFCIYSSTV